MSQPNIGLRPVESDNKGAGRRKSGPVRISRFDGVARNADDANGTDDSKDSDYAAHAAHADDYGA